MGLLIGMLWLLKICFLMSYIAIHNGDVGIC
jgi:hypothetical protein